MCYACTSLASVMQQIKDQNYTVVVSYGGLGNQSFCRKIHLNDDVIKTGSCMSRDIMGRQHSV